MLDACTKVLFPAKVVIIQQHHCFIDGQIKLLNERFAFKHHFTRALCILLERSVGVEYWSGVETDFVANVVHSFALRHNRT